MKKHERYLYSALLIAVAIGSAIIFHAIGESDITGSVFTGLLGVCLLFGKA